MSSWEPNGGGGHLCNPVFATGGHEKFFLVFFLQKFFCYFLAFCTALAKTPKNTNISKKFFVSPPRCKHGYTNVPPPLRAQEDTILLKLLSSRRFKPCRTTMNSTPPSFLSLLVACVLIHPSVENVSKRNDLTAGFLAFFSFIQSAFGDLLTVLIANGAQQLVAHFRLQS